MEILSPAGGEEALRAAVFSGADAVYLGGKAFGARAGAKNFDMRQLKEAVEFCHARGVRVHVTVNTLLKDAEINEALDFVAYLCSISVDAVLVQDMGLFSLIRERAPGLVLHASTQMSLHTPGGAKYLKELGADRVVLARELSLDEIAEIAGAADTELEAFVHGALCMSVSGQCYLSAMIGGRSGNRGMCAQPCRLPFAANGGTGYDLSLKDLSFAQELYRLKEAGVCSAKIEGRMKRPEYVAAATAVCRRAADREAVPRELTDSLGAVFSRSGFTRGYLEGKRGREMFGVRRREDVEGATQKVFSSLHTLYKNERQSVPVFLGLSEDLTLTASDEDGRTASVRAAESAAAEKKLSRERCLEQLKKTGGTPFSAQRLTAPENGAALSVSQLNALRREALNELLNLRKKRAPIPFNKRAYSPSAGNSAHEQTLALRLHFRSVSRLFKEAKNCESIVLPLYTPLHELKALREEGYKNILLEQPRAFFGAEKQVIAMMRACMDEGFCDFVCGNLGGVYIAKQIGANIHGAYGLNITNTASLDFFEREGLASAELSFELKGSEAKALGGTLRRGLMVYGRQALMLLRNCPLANSKKGCLNCKTPGYLTDRMNKKFPVMCTGMGDARYSELFNCLPLYIKKQEIKGADFAVMRFTVENSVESAEILRAWQALESIGAGSTRGLFMRGVE